MSNKSAPTRRSLDGSARRCALGLILIFLGALGPLAGRGQDDGVRSRVIRKPDRQRDLSHRLSPEAEESIRQWKARNRSKKSGKSDSPAQSSDTPARPAEPSLYRRFPGDQVVVGDVGGVHTMTRRQLEQAMLARYGELNTAGLDPYIARSRESQYLELMNQILTDWAVGKTLVLLAERAGMQVTPGEVAAKMQEWRGDYEGGSLDQDLAQRSRLVGRTPEQLRQDITEGLLIDKYITAQIGKRFNENDLKNLYLRFPQRYVTPARFHGWQIVRRLDPEMSDQEKKDVRAEFYELRRELARQKKGGGLLGVFRGKSDDDPTNDEDPFQRIAVRESDDPLTKDRGGDLGWIPVTSAMEPKLFEAFQRLEIGDVSQIVELSHELHGALYILRVTERQPATGTTYDAVVRARVLNDLLASYKSEMGPILMRDRSTPFKVHLNSGGLWLLGQRPSESELKAPKTPSADWPQRQTPLFAEFPE